MPGIPEGVKDVCQTTCPNRSLLLFQLLELSSHTTGAGKNVLYLSSPGNWYWVFQSVQCNSFVESSCKHKLVYVVNIEALDRAPIVNECIQHLPFQTPQTYHIIICCCNPAIPERDPSHLEMQIISKCHFVY